MINRTAARPVGQSPTAMNAHDPVTSERGGPSPYRAVEPWLLLYISILHEVQTKLTQIMQDFRSYSSDDADSNLWEIIKRGLVNSY
jgi:hypothetical protein